MLVVNAALAQCLLELSVFWPFGISCLEIELVIQCLAFGSKRTMSWLNTNSKGLPHYRENHYSKINSHVLISNILSDCSPLGFAFNNISYLLINKL